MYVFNHRIAGIHFRTEMDTWVPWLDNSHFRSFVYDDVEPDVRLRLFCIYPGSLTQPPIDPQVIARLSHCVGFNPKYLDSPLLRAEAVSARLHAVVDHPEQVGLEIKQSSAVIFDFDQSELDIFFTCGKDFNYSSSRLESILFCTLSGGF